MTNYEDSWCRVPIWIYSPFVYLWLRRSSDGGLEGVYEHEGRIDPDWLYSSEWYPIPDDDDDYPEWIALLKRYELERAHEVKPLALGAL